MPPPPEKKARRLAAQGLFVASAGVLTAFGVYSRGRYDRLRWLEGGGELPRLQLRPPPPAPQAGVVDDDVVADADVHNLIAGFFN